MDIKKFLDREGLTYLWKKLSLQDYPNNDTLVAVINAIDEGKMDKTTAIPLIEQAIAGQVPVVKSVDENGKPLEWEAGNLPEGLPSTDATNQYLTIDADGNRVWEEKLAYPYEEIEVLLEKTTSENPIDITEIKDKITFGLYSIICDGVETRCDVDYIIDLKGYAGGNASLANLGEDTGEPVFIYKGPENSLYLNTSGEHTVKISKVNQYVKYLPEDLLRFIPFPVRIDHMYSSEPSWNMIKMSRSAKELRTALASAFKYSITIILEHYDQDTGESFTRLLTKWTIDRNGINGGFRYILNFGEDLAPYIVDINADTIIADPNWVAPEDVATKTDVSALQSAIDTLNGTGEGSVRDTVADAIANVVANAPEELNTLKEIADWIANDETGTVNLIERVEKAEEDIEALKPLDVQSDWNQTDETAMDFIKNKPDEAAAIALATETGLIDPITASDGSFYTDKNGVVYSLI